MTPINSEEKTRHNVHSYLPRYDPTRLILNHYYISPRNEITFRSFEPNCIHSYVRRTLPSAWATQVHANLHYQYAPIYIILYINYSTLSFFFPSKSSFKILRRENHCGHIPNPHKPNTIGKWEERKESWPGYLRIEQKNGGKIKNRRRKPRDSIFLVQRSKMRRNGKGRRGEGWYSHDRAWAEISCFCCSNTYKALHKPKSWSLRIKFPFSSEKEG